MLSRMPDPMTEWFNWAAHFGHCNACREAEFMSKNSGSVSHILAERHNLQVVEPIIGLNPVFMVDRHLWRNPDESLSNHAMGIAHELLAVLAKDMLLIPIALIDISAHDSGPAALIAHNSADSAHAADLIKREVFNGSPRFHTCNLTTTGEVIL